MRLGAEIPCIFALVSRIVSHDYSQKSRCRRLLLISDWESVYVYFTARALLRHHTLLRENDDHKPLLRIKRGKFFSARGLITREIMRSKDAQCNTGNDLENKS